MGDEATLSKNNIKFQIGTNPDHEKGIEYVEDMKNTERKPSKIKRNAILGEELSLTFKLRALNRNKTIRIGRDSTQNSLM